MAAILIGTAVVVLDSSMAPIMLPSFAAHFGLEATAVVPLVVCHQIATAVAIIPAAAYGNNIGLARIFRLGLIFQIVGALLVILAPQIGMMYLGRLVQGLGSGAIVAVGMALIRNISPLEKLGPILGWYGMIVSLASAIGPLTGGILSDLVHWRYSIFLGVVPAIPSLILFLNLPQVSCRPSARPDVLSTILAAVAISTLILAVTWIKSTLVFLLIFVSICSWIIFIRRQLRVSPPALQIRLFSNWQFAAASITSSTSFAGLSLMWISSVFMLQHDLAHNAKTTSMTLLFMALGTACAAPVAGRLLTRMRADLLCCIGSVTVVLPSCLLWAGTGALWEISLAMVIMGVGTGLFQSPNNQLLMLQSPREDSASASAILALSRTVGMGAGAALAAVLLQTPATEQEASLAASALKVASMLFLAAFSLSLTRTRITSRKKRFSPHR